MDLQFTFHSNPALIVNCIKKKKKRQKIPAPYFPCSAVMYSSHEIVLGAGATRDCLLTGCRKKCIMSYVVAQNQHRFYSSY